MKTTRRDTIAEELGQNHVHDSVYVSYAIGTEVTYVNLVPGE
jgi:hypothetical protein